MLKEKVQAAAGETIVTGVKEKIQQDISENWKVYAKYALCAIGAIAGVNLLFNAINRPRPQRMDMHFYVHFTN